jgi:hypothetical protein
MQDDARTVDHNRHVAQCLDLEKHLKALHADFFAQLDAKVGVSPPISHVVYFC